MKEDLEGEMWEDIPGYEGLYQASTFGRIYSLPKKHRYCNHNGRILKQSKGKKKRYLDVVLRKNSKSTTFFVHKLVALTFLNHQLGDRKVVIDHIDNNPINNCLSNLQITTIRNNSSKDKCGYVSEYIGVQRSWKRWKALIRLEGYQLHLGTEDSEVDAAELYIKALKKYESDPLFYKDNISHLTYEERRKYILN